MKIAKIPEQDTERLNAQSQSDRKELDSQIINLL